MSRFSAGRRKGIFLVQFVSQDALSGGSVDGKHSTDARTGLTATIDSLPVLSAEKERRPKPTAPTCARVATRLLRAAHVATDGCSPRTERTDNFLDARTGRTAAIPETSNAHEGSDSGWGWGDATAYP